MGKFLLEKLKIRLIFTLMTKVPNTPNRSDPIPPLSTDDILRALQDATGMEGMSANNHDLYCRILTVGCNEQGMGATTRRWKLDPAQMQTLRETFRMGHDTLTQ